MFRTSLKAALPVAAAAAALAACGPIQMGAAATFAHSRITASQLDSELQQLRDGISSAGVAGHLQFNGSMPGPVVLNWLLQFRIWDQVAAQEGVTVTQAQVDQVINGQGGAAAFTKAAVSAGIPPDRIGDVAHWLAVREVLATRLGIDSSGNLSQAAATRLTGDLESAVRTLKLKVNPQYGVLVVGNAQAGIVATPDILSRPASPAPQPSSAGG